MSIVSSIVFCWSMILDLEGGAVEEDVDIGRLLCSRSSCDGWAEARASSRAATRWLKS